MRAVLAMIVGAVVGLLFGPGVLLGLIFVALLLWRKQPFVPRIKTRRRKA